MGKRSDKHTAGPTLHASGLVPNTIYSALHPITGNERAGFEDAHPPSRSNTVMSTDSKPIHAIEPKPATPNTPKSVTSLHAVETEIDPATAASKIAPITVGNPATAASLAIDQEHLEEFADPDAKSSVVECRRPVKGSFFTVRPELARPWRDRRFYFLLELEGRDPYIVAPLIANEKKKEEDTIRPVMLVRFVTMTGEEGLWPLKLNPSDGRSNSWNTSALNILSIAEKGWVRMLSLKKEYGYQKSKKTLEETPPQFSDRTFDELVDAAFTEGQTVTSLDHPIWEELKNGSKKK